MYPCKMKTLWICNKMIVPYNVKYGTNFYNLFKIYLKLDPLIRSLRSLLLSNSLFPEDSKSYRTKQ